MSASPSAGCGRRGSPRPRSACEQAITRRRRVEADGVAEAAALGRVGATARSRPRLSPGGVRRRRARRSGDARRRGRRGRARCGRRAPTAPELVAVVDHLLERERDAMMRPSNSGMATPMAASMGARPGVDAAHSADGLAGRRRLEDRARRARPARDVPLVAVESAGAPRARADAAPAQHGGDHDVDAALGAAASSAGTAPRRRAAASSTTPASASAPGALDARRTGRRRTACSRPRGGPGRRRRRCVGPGRRRAPRLAASTPCAGTSTGRLEAEALEQHGVGHEPQQVLEVRRGRRATR